MKQVNFLHILIFTFSIVLLDSCTVIGGVFKAGMGFGIFIVVAIIALIAVFIMRGGKNKN
ncbi:MAG: hypothetical protein ABIO46_07695 [Chitinophagales bacterium]